MTKQQAIETAQRLNDELVDVSIYYNEEEDLIYTSDLQEDYEPMSPVEWAEHYNEFINENADKLTIKCPLGEN